MRLVSDDRPGADPGAGVDDRAGAYRAPASITSGSDRLPRRSSPAAAAAVCRARRGPRSGSRPPTSVPACTTVSDPIRAPAPICAPSWIDRARARLTSSPRLHADTWARRHACGAISDNYLTRSERSSEFCSASSTRTTRSPLSPSERGRSPVRTHSTKCSHSIRSGSTLAIRGEKMSPERVMYSP